MTGSGSTATGAVYVNSTVGDDASWGTPFILPVAGVSTAPDDISTVVAYGRKWIGVLWSNQVDDSMYWAIHMDGQAVDQWRGTTAVHGNGQADDHMNLKSIQADSAGRVYAAVKTSTDDGGFSSSATLIDLMVFKPATGNWTIYPFGTVADCQTRPIVALDSENQIVHMFATAPTGPGCPYSGYPGAIYEKTAPMSSPAFAPGRGIPVIRTGPSSALNDATTTKQDVTSATGLVVLAGDGASQRYWHLDESLASGPPPPPPTAAFSANVTSGPAPLAVTFTDQSTGAPTAWSWTFGDGATSTVQSPSHTYAAAGTYDVTLTASNAGGPNSLTKTAYITVSSVPPPPPTAAFSANVTSGPAPLAVTFTDQSTGAPTAWSWTFGDGATSTVQSPSHTYAAAGTYDVTLTASNAGGPNSLTKTAYITVSSVPPPPPTAAFSANVTSGPAPLAVTFTDQSTGAPTAWSWTFGDGATSTVQSPSHTYAAAGTYDVTLTASNAGGPNSLTKTAYITVSSVPPPPPTAAFSANVTSGPAPLAVTFTDQSTGAPTAWSWTFGDGATSTVQSPSHTYAAAGTYDVTLTASNAGGPNSLTKTAYITVSSATVSYSATVLADGPTSYWRLGERSGTTLADTAGTNRGTANGGVVLGVPGALAGDPDTAVGLGSNSAYVSVANAANLDFGGDFSVEAWAKPTVLNGVGGAVVHKGGASGYTVWQYRLSVTSANQWRGTVFVGNSAITVTAPGSATTAWTHLVMTKAGTTLRLYVNGVQAASATVNGTVNTSTGILAIGRTGSSSSDYFNGAVDEVAVYPLALSASRVAAHFAAASGPPPPP